MKCEYCNGEVIYPGDDGYKCINCGWVDAKWWVKYQNDKHSEKKSSRNRQKKTNKRMSDSAEENSTPSLQFEDVN